MVKTQGHMLPMRCSQSMHGCQIFPDGDPPISQVHPPWFPSCQELFIRVLSGNYARVHACSHEQEDETEGRQEAAAIEGMNDFSA